VNLPAELFNRFCLQHLFFSWPFLLPANSTLVYLPYGVAPSTHSLAWVWWSTLSWITCCPFTLFNLVPPQRLAYTFRFLEIKVRTWKTGIQQQNLQVLYRGKHCKKEYVHSPAAEQHIVQLPSASLIVDQLGSGKNTSEAFPRGAVNVSVTGVLCIEQQLVKKTYVYLMLLLVLASPTAL
jgi:hypothetical protein